MNFQILSSFLQVNFSRWTSFVCVETLSETYLQREGKTLKSEVYQIGIDILFSVESLKSSQDPLVILLTEHFIPSKTPKSQLRVVPMIYKAYVQETRKHRFSVFGSGSSPSQDQTVQGKIRDAGMTAFMNSYKTLREFGDDLEVWQSVVSLLEVLEEANIVGSGSSENTNILRKLPIMGHIAYLPLPDEPRRLESALRILCVLSHVDFEIINPLLSEIFSGLITIQSTSFPSAQALLHNLLDFHSKTRTIPSYLSTLIDCLSGCPTSKRIVKKYTEPIRLHRDCASGSLLGLAHLEEVSRAVKGFLTSGQTPEAVQALLEIFNASWSSYSDDHNAMMDVDENEAMTAVEILRKSENKKSKRRKVETLSIPMSARELSAVSYSLVARVIAIVLPSLPFSTLPEPSYAILRSSITEAWMGIRKNAALIAFNALPETSVGERWASQIVTASTLRICHALNMCPSLRSLDTMSTETVPSGQTASMIRSAGTTPELIVELINMLCSEISSPEHLLILADMCLLQGNTGHDASPSSLSFNWDLEQAMRSAAFWELPRLRDALIFVLDKASENAQGIDLDKLLKQIQFKSKNTTISWALQQVQLIASVFEMLLRAPREYLPRASRSTFFRRALVADLAIFLTIHQSTVELINGHRTRMVIRAWLSSISDTSCVLDIVPDPQDCIVYLTIPASGPEDVVKVYNTATVDLLGHAHRQIVRSAINNKYERMESLCASLQHSISADQRGDKTVLPERSLLQFIEILVSEIQSTDKLSEAPLRAVEGLYSSLNAQLSTAMEDLLSESAFGSSAENESTVRVYRACFVLRRWLGVNASINHFGGILLQKLITSGQDQNPQSLKSLGTQIFSLLLEELYSVAPQEHEVHLALIVSSYVLLLSRLDLADEEDCDSALRRATRMLSITDFTFVLSLLREALMKGLSSNRELQSIVHLSHVLISEAPEGALKITQEHFEECLQIFANAIFVSGDADLSLEVLTFIRSVCSDRPASIRLISVGPIWALLSRLLSGSHTHTVHTHTPILHAISSTAGALVRLRRDLVRATLPHLAGVLRQLLSALRVPRTQLGSRQRALVADTLPWWVSPAAPPGPEEARAVARLLTDRDKEKEKEKGAEALAGAFSKHAGPVMGAYVGALGDALVVLAPTVRAALAPGLYALCDMMGEYGRDALMVGGLDASGRVALKALWREYEKQKYVGKG
ncbi:hypothetical protein EW145_g684 [Phellinidium pouzarii]|uniref:Nucleolar 27S pre-rRNA processing Urb2/Npa2 C-terminal domain-containing protein n=1 Tax=Phellinidium pouzarii TaxID=167371 RepID=A0A4S4LHA0_9AGAM|nr:hypothetical protein EW145_g684 [Phellinidium pouzarii]